MFIVDFARVQSQYTSINQQKFPLRIVSLRFRFFPPTVTATRPSPTCCSPTQESATSGSWCKLGKAISLCEQSCTAAMKFKNSTLKTITTNTLVSITSSRCPNGQSYTGRSAPIKRGHEHLWLHIFSGTAQGKGVGEGGGVEGLWLGLRL